MGFTNMNEWNRSSTPASSLRNIHTTFSNNNNNNKKILFEQLYKKYGNTLADNQIKDIIKSATNEADAHYRAYVKSYEQYGEEYQEHMNKVFEIALSGIFDAFKSLKEAANYYSEIPSGAYTIPCPNLEEVPWAPGIKDPLYKFTMNRLENTIPGFGQAAKVAEIAGKVGGAVKGVGGAVKGVGGAVSRLPGKVGDTVKSVGQTVKGLQAEVLKLVKRRTMTEIGGSNNSNQAQTGQRNNSNPVPAQKKQIMGWWHRNGATISQQRDERGARAIEYPKKREAAAIKEKATANKKKAAANAAANKKKAAANRKKAAVNAATQAAANRKKAAANAATKAAVNVATQATANKAAANKEKAATNKKLADVQKSWDKNYHKTTTKPIRKKRGEIQVAKE